MILKRRLDPSIQLCVGGGQEPQVMGAKTGGWTRLPYLLILAHHAIFAEVLSRSA